MSDDISGGVGWIVGPLSENGCFGQRPFVSRDLDESSGGRMSFHFAWRLVYDRLSFLFDFVSDRVSGGRWRSWGRLSVSYVRGRRVLELGHGPGHLLMELKKSGHQPTGIDPSRGMGKLAARRLRRAGLRVPIVRSKAQALPFRAGSFDAAVAAFPTDDILRLESLQEVARVVRQGGRFALVVGAQRRGSQPDPFFIDWLNGFIGQNRKDRDGSLPVLPRAGFRSRIECRSVDGSPVVLLIAEKWQRKDGWVNALPSVRVSSKVRILSREYSREVIEGRATDPDGDRLTYRWLREQTVLLDWREVGERGELSLEFQNLPPLEIGRHALTLEVSDPYETVKNTVGLIIENSPPVIMSIREKITEAGGPAVMTAHVSDYDGDAVNYRWLEEETVLASGRVRTEKGGKPVRLTVTICHLTIGTHTVSLQVSDGVNPPVWDTATVTVVDTAPAQEM